MKYWILLVLMFTLIIPAFSFNLVQNGKANAKVVVGSDATEPEKNAAKEFVKYIKQISGANLDIVAVPSKGNNVFIGQTSLAKKALGDFNWNQITDDGIIIKSSKNSLVLSGDRPRGTLYAVYSYLEDYLGCMFLTKDAEVVPTKKTISVNNLNIVYNPPFMSRESYFKPNMVDPTFDVKLKLNGHHNVISDDWGGHISLVGWCHTLPALISVAEYGQTHPEYFALRNGTRSLSGHDQVCLSNKDMLKELTKKVLAKIAENPNTKLISVTQADQQNYCTCPECTKLTEEYGNSGALLTVVNAVAKEVKKKYPDVYVETLAYQYTRSAPKNIKPDDNVIIRLCTIECDFSTPLDSDTNKTFYKDLQDWKKVAKNLYIWDYTVNFSNYHIMHPNFQSLQRNVQIFANNNVKAVFEQGDSFNSNLAMSHLKSWLLAKLLWNPNMDYEKAKKAYLNAYYGKAAGDMNEYINVTTKAVQREHAYLTCFMGSNPYFKTDDYIKCFKLLNSAVKKVDNNPVLKDRVLCELYSFQVGWLLAPKEVNKAVADSGVLGKYNTKYNFLRMYYDFAKSHDNEYISEGRSIDNSVLAFAKSHPKEGTTPKECENLPNDVWVDYQENSFMHVLTENHSKNVEDKDASNGKAVWQAPNHVDWSVQKTFSTLFFNDDYNYADLYVVYKVIPNTKVGKAYEMGVYNPTNGEYLLRLDINSNDTPDGKYTTKLLGRLNYNVSPNTFLYLNPMGDQSLSKESLLKGIYVDRIFAIQGK